MSRYTDVNMLIKKYIDTDIKKFSNSDVKIVLENLKQNILKAPTIEPKRGEWIDKGWKGDRALDFVVELIEYIFEYPDDDYMTMECLCRKLHKYGLVDKKDGFYLVAGDTLRKNEPTEREGE